MIQAEQYPAALRALQRLIVHAKARAYDVGESKLADFLNDVELLPEFLQHNDDRTKDFQGMLHGIAQIHPECRYIVDEFESMSIPANNVD